MIASGDSGGKKETYPSGKVKKKNIYIKKNKKIKGGNTQMEEGKSLVI